MVYASFFDVCVLQVRKCAPWLRIEHRSMYCFRIVFSARQHVAYLYMLTALYANARPYVRLSVRHTGGSYKNG